MPWYDDLENWIPTDRKRSWLEDVITRAALARVVSWQAAHDMLKAMADDDSYTCTPRAHARAREETV